LTMLNLHRTLKPGQARRRETKRGYGTPSRFIFK
jgi:hypothetical protein